MVRPDRRDLILPLIYPGPHPGCLLPVPEVVVTRVARLLPDVPRGPRVLLPRPGGPYEDRGPLRGETDGL